MNLIERLKEARTQADEARWKHEKEPEGRSPRERVRNSNQAWRNMRDAFDMKRAIEQQAEEIARVYAQEKGLPVPNNRRECRVLWEAIGEAWADYDVPLRLPGVTPKPSRRGLDDLDVAAKELSASEALQLEKATGKALEWLDEQREGGEISEAKYQNARTFIFNIGLDAHQTSEAIIDELVLDFMKKQDDDWNRSIDDIYDEWTEEQASDELDVPMYN